MKTCIRHKTLQDPSKPRRREGLTNAAHCGITPGAPRTNSQLYALNPQLVSRTYPKVQIFTVEDYFAGKRPALLWSQS